MKIVFAICTTSLESIFATQKPKVSSLKIFPRVPALTGSVTEMVTEPVKAGTNEIRISCRLQSQILADDPFSRFCKLLGVIIF